MQPCSLVDALGSLWPTGATALNAPSPTSRLDEVRTRYDSVSNDLCRNYGVLLCDIGLSRQRLQLQTLGHADNA